LQAWLMVSLKLFKGTPQLHALDHSCELDWHFYKLDWNCEYLRRHYACAVKLAFE
jgi:hypothetical protein